MLQNVIYRIPMSLSPKYLRKVCATEEARMTTKRVPTTAKKSMALNCLEYSILLRHTCFKSLNPFNFSIMRATLAQIRREDSGHVSISGHLPRWYPVCRSRTLETKIFGERFRGYWSRGFHRKAFCHCFCRNMTLRRKSFLQRCSGFHDSLSTCCEPYPADFAAATSSSKDNRASSTATAGSQLQYFVLHNPSVAFLYLSREKMADEPV